VCKSVEKLNTLLVEALAVKTKRYLPSESEKFLGVYIDFVERGLLDFENTLVNTIEIKLNVNVEQVV
jgi:hypothetical protein